MACKTTPGVPYRRLEKRREPRFRFSLTPCGFVGKRSFSAGKPAMMESKAMPQDVSCKAVSDRPRTRFSKELRHAAPRGPRRTNAVWWTQTVGFLTLYLALWGDSVAATARSNPFAGDTPVPSTNGSKGGPHPVPPSMAPGAANRPRAFVPGPGPAFGPGLPPTPAPSVLGMNSTTIGAAPSHPTDPTEPPGFTTDG